MNKPLQIGSCDSPPVAMVDVYFLLVNLDGLALYKAVCRLKNANILCNICDINHDARADAIFFMSHKSASSPYINHFLQPDSIISGYGNPQNLNRYSYVGNRPVNFNDPTGHFCTDGGKRVDCETGKIMKGSTGGSGNGGGGGYNTGHRDILDLKKKGPSVHDICSGKNRGGPCASDAPTVTNTPVPNTGPVWEDGTPHLNVSIEFNIDLAEVDGIDVAVDVAGLTGDASLFIPSFATPEVYAASEFAEGAGLIKNGAELMFGNPKGLMYQVTQLNLEKSAVLFFRLERLVPWVGFVGNLGSLYLTLKPEIYINISYK